MSRADGLFGCSLPWQRCASGCVEVARSAATLNEGAIVRLVGALTDEQTDEWQVTRRYMGQDVLRRLVTNNGAQALIDEKKVA